MKLRVAAVFLVLICLVALLPVTGCQAATAADACGTFLEHIRLGEYALAYDMLHSSVRYDEARKQQDILDGRAQSETRISKEQFTEQYTNRFELLAITDFTYTLTRSVEGDVVCVYDYTLQYQSDLLEDEELSFRMSVLRENGLWTIEWSPALLFPEMDWGDTIRVGTTQAKRGEILADGVVYAQTVTAISVLAYPAKLGDKEQFARQAGILLEMPTETILKRINAAKGDFIILKQYYPDQFTESLEAQFLLLPGISIDKSNFGTLRTYPQGDMLAHVIGYVGHATEEDLEALTGSKKGNELYNTDSLVGKAGLERVYEPQLRGMGGSFIYISAADGLNKHTLYRVPAKDGLDVQLTLDPVLQDRADKLLKYSLYGEHTAGAVVVLDPTTGYILAMSSYPSYDLNEFARGISQASYNALLNQANKPLFNRLTQGRYPPGSIFKPFTAAAALESGAMTTETVFPAGHGERIEDDRWLPSDSGEFGPWGASSITRVELRNRHSPLNMHNGIIDSDNIYFAYAALRTGIDNFVAFGEKLGMNESIPFETPVSPAQLKTKDSAAWRPMLLAESAFGQGEVLMTPLQAASMFSAFANGGSIMRPSVVKGLYRVEGIGYVCEEANEPALWKEKVVAQSSVDTIVPMLEDVIAMGTGHELRLPNVAGKTGTAQIGNDRSREIVWFVGFRLRTDDPRLVLVMLEIPANDRSLALSRFEITRALLKEEG